jgi:flagellar biosynthesis GTPase FlhF
VKIFPDCFQSPVPLLLIAIIIMIPDTAITESPTEAEIGELERQIEQQEAEARKRAEVEAIRKEEEQKKLKEEQHRIEEEKRQAEENRIAEMERQRMEEEARKKAEQEKQYKINLLIADAEQAVRDKDRVLAMNKYNEVLVIEPNNPVANSGLKEAEKLLDKVCYEFLGKWVWVDGFNDKMEILENGTIIASSPLGDKTFHWTCIPENRQLKHDRQKTNKYKHLLVFTLSADGTCITDPLLWPSDGCWRRSDGK